MNENLQPIFIMGAPRSGTTMLAGMLSNRDDALALPEMHYIHKLLEEELMFEYVDKGKIFKTLKESFMFRDLNIVESDNDIEKLIGENVRGTIFNILKAYNDKYMQKDFKIWVEHSPHNHIYFDVLLGHYPNAKFIHIVRDGRAVYRSTKEVDWGYKDVITGAINWNENVRSCMLKAKVFKDIVYTVRYEDLTNDSEKYLRDICNFLNIEFVQSMLESKGVRKPSFAKYAKELGEKAHTKSQALWRVSLTKKEIEHFTAYNYNLLKYYNYDIKSFNKKKLKGLDRLITKIIGRLKVFYFRKKFKKRISQI